MLAALLSAAAGIYIAFYATGGSVASLGFIALGVTWFYTSLKGYTFARNGQLVKHQEMMLYSYAACFSAVTLRIYLPLLTMYFHNFIQAYLWVAWLCWIPNIIVAYFLVLRLRRRKRTVVCEVSLVES